MGWLDALFSNDRFDPQADSGAGSGWLGPIAGGLVAPPNVSAPPPAASTSAMGRPPAQPNPPVSPIDRMDGGIGGLFGPPHPGGAPGGPGLLDRLTAGASNLASGGNPIAGLVNAVNGLATGQRTDHAGIELAKQHATMSALMNAGLDLNTARAAAMNPDYLKALVVAHYGARPRRGAAAASPRAGGENVARKEPAATNGVAANDGRAAVPPADASGPRS
jgi:hypothetical protein